MEKCYWFVDLNVCVQQLFTDIINLWYDELTQNRHSGCWQTGHAVGWQARPAVGWQAGPAVCWFRAEICIFSPLTLLHYTNVAKFH